jgi:hypothetical protein
MTNPLLIKEKAGLRRRIVVLLGPWKSTLPTFLMM